MKNYLVALIIALFLTAAALDTGAPPQLVGICIGNAPREANHTDSKVRDEQYGDFLYSDDMDAKMKMRTNVVDSGERNDTTFPMRGTGI